MTAIDTSQEFAPSSHMPSMGPTPEAPRPLRPPRRTDLVALVSALVIFVVVLGAGSVYLLSRPKSYQATASLALLPRTDLSTADQASYYDTLSRGQIVSTAAKVANDAVGRTGLPSVSVLVVPETSVITLTVKARTPDDVRSIIGTSVSRATGAITSLKLPYTANLVQSGNDSVSEVTPNLTKNVAVVAVVALALGAATQQLLSSIRRKRRS